MDDRVYLVGCILQGMAASNNMFFGMAEEAIAVADAALIQMAEPLVLGEMHESDH